jgi:1-acyl-sn-glycerol-3-phosphate acyltransferase
MQQNWLSILWYEGGYCLCYAVGTLGLSLRTEGARHMPRSGPALVVANHQSFLDPVLVGLAVRRRLRYLARKTLFRHRALAWLMSSLGGVPVDHHGVAKEGLRTALDLLQVGEALVLFPEGHRTETGQMQPFRPGVHLLLKRTTAPVVPVGIAGAYRAFPRTQRLPTLSPLFWPAPRGAIAVSVGKPLPPEHFAEMPRDKVLDELVRAVQAVAARAERLCRKA